jgi:guanylate kinase
MARLPGARLSISTTTRQPRGAEKDGQDYHFVDRARFQDLISQGAFLEWALVHGNLYGTGRAVLDGLTPDNSVIFDIDVKGGNALKAEFPEALTVFVLPPSLQILEQRLRGRQTEDEAAIAQRLAASHDEIRRGLERYDYAIINLDLEEAVADVLAILRAEALRLAASRRQLMKSFGTRGPAD